MALCQNEVSIKRGGWISGSLMTLLWLYLGITMGLPWGCYEDKSVFFGKKEKNY